MSTVTSTNLSCAIEVPRLTERPLLSGEQGAELAGLFKVLANDSRLRLLHALVRSGELCVTELAEALDMSAQAVSNQLQRLVDRRVVAQRRAGNFIYYRVVDPCVPGLMDLGLCLLEETRSAPGDRR